MMKFSLVAMLFFLLAGSAFSQDKRPVAIPAPAGDGDVVRISTNLIQLDVTVTDKKGQPVTDLRRDEIEIYENGKKKNIAGLSFVRGTRSAGAQAPVRGSANQTVLPAPPIRPGAVRRTVAIVVDDLNLSFPSTFWVREALKKFINEQIQEGDVVAIVRSGAGVGALQQFTADRRQLLAAVDRVKWNSLGSGKTSFFSPARDTGGSSEGQELDQLREEIFAAGTLGAVNFVVRGMKE
ncbi:MAG: VWA domain-containing protein, partial [Pyrinomonadaceae bacterium]